MVIVEQSQAVTLLIGPFVDEDDGKTAETALTITQADVRLSKNGGNMAQKSDTSSCTHDEIGYYTCPLNATDTGTVGILKVMVHETGALPVWMDVMVVPSNVYDSLVGGTDRLQVHADEITAGLITAAAIATGAIDADAIAANAIGSSELATDAIGADQLAAAAVDEIWDENMEGTHTAREMLRLFAAALVSKVSGGGTTTITFRDIDDTKNRIVATVDSNGNRTAVTLTET